MNYEKIYNQLIEKRQNEVLSKNTCYCETHHIIPKSFGGNNNQDNLVNLTAREHYFAHILLVKISKLKYGKNSNEYISMTYALFRMSNTKKMSKYKLQSKLYAQLKEEFRIQQKMRVTGANNPMYGKKLTDAQKEYLSNKFSGKNNPMYGRDWRENKTIKEIQEHNKKISSAHHKKTKIEKQKIIAKIHNTRSKWSEEKYNKIKQHMSESQRNMSIEKRELRKQRYRITWSKKSQKELDRLNKIRSHKGNKNGTYGSKFMYKENKKPIRVMPQNFNTYLALGYKFSDKSFKLK